MSWRPHGPSDTGLVQTSRHGQSKTAPALATYRGRLWVLWADLDGNTWYAFTDDDHQDAEFSQRLPFPLPGLPVMTNLNGHLHALIVVETGDVAHFLYDDEESNTWTALEPLTGLATHCSPSLTAFHNKLFLAFLRAGELYYAIWTNSTASPNSASDPSGTWSAPRRISESSQNFTSIPALFVLKGVLHLLCGADPANGDIVCFSYDYIASTWSLCNDVSEGRAARGVSATSYGDKAFLGFIEDGPGDESHAVCVASCINGQWQPHEMVLGQNASDPPQIAVLNGRIHCIFNENTPGKDLRWYSRPLLTYSLSTWMSSIPDLTPISRVTIPGTHDSCARSNIPFVRTQYLTLTQQFRLGIRFIDLRLRLHGESALFCYHGGIPLNLPRRLPFSAVVDEMCSFLRDNPTETIIVSINNDDPSVTDPAPFYRAVETALLPSRSNPFESPLGWYVDPRTPNIGSVRGCAVLLRRYRGDPAVPPNLRIGLDLSAWIDDSPHFVIATPANVQIHIQDKWRFSDRVPLGDLVASKSSFVQQLMAQAVSEEVSSSSDNTCCAEDWYINFCSAVGDPVDHGEIAEAKWIAVGAHSDWNRKWVSGMNVLTREFLAESLLQNLPCNGGNGGSGRARLGIVNLDYPELPEDNDLVSRLIELNF